MNDQEREAPPEPFASTSRKLMDGPLCLGSKFQRRKPDLSSTRRAWHLTSVKPYSYNGGMSETRYTTPDGKRRMEFIKLNDQHYLSVTDPRGHGKTIVPLPGQTAHGAGAFPFIKVKLIRQFRTIKGEQTELTLLAPVTVNQLANAGITHKQLEAWGLAVPPVKRENAA